MKKIVLSLLGAATLATASNAMALDTTHPFTVLITAGRLVPIMAGAAVFDFDSEAVNFPAGASAVPGAAPPPFPLVPSPTGLFPGSCVYQMEWINSLPSPTLGGSLPLSAGCFIAEQKVHGAVSCLANAMTAVPSVVTALVDPNPMNDACDGFNPFAQISKVATLQLGETFPAQLLQGIVQFQSAIPNHTIYGIQFASGHI